MVKSNTPQHIAIIMDGNGRWARAKGLPRIAGHRRGAEVVKTVIRACKDMGVKFLTLYTFSTENWKRPKREIDFLMRLLNKYLTREKAKLIENDVKFLAIGRLEALPDSVKKVIKQITEITRDNRAITLILALNYGGRVEILDAVKEVAKDINTGKLDPQELDEEVFSRYLYTHKIPDPDLLIRTSGEMRLSNFLLWQLSYSELFISDKFWPDFTEQDLLAAVEDFRKRERRFGALDRKN
ncbi:MAG: isoprenyl transferase [Candidatus Omnitrophica bacterium]|nr:isoprenyl transferase [Candidatus Omnitrophota bacterium]MBU1924954.1 isoprenyl transferase [Candidatus Omnitrophota bacterium]